MPQENFNPTKYKMIDSAPSVSPQGVQPVKQSGNLLDLLGPMQSFQAGKEAGTGLNPADINPATVMAGKLQEFLGKSSTLPTAGGVLGQGIGSLSHIPGARTALSGLGTFTGERLRQMNARGGLESIIPNQQELGQAAVKGGTTAAIDAILGLGGKALKFVGGKIAPQIKLAFPEGVQKSFGVAKKKAFGVIDDLLNVNKDVVIDTKPILDELLSRKKQELAVFDKIAAGEVQNVIDRISKFGPKMTARQANDLGDNFGKYVFGRGGKETVARGAPTIAKKESMMMAAGTLEEELKRQIPGMEEALKNYANLAKAAREMGRPFQGWWKGSVAGMMLQPLGMSSSPVSAGIAAMAMPYSRLMLQKLLGQTGQAVGTPLVRGGVEAGANMLMGGQ